MSKSKTKDLAQKDMEYGTAMLEAIQEANSDDHDPCEPYFDDPGDSTISMVISMIMTNGITIEDKSAHLTKLVERLVTYVQSQDAKVTKLKNKIEKLIKLPKLKQSSLSYLNW